MDPANIHELATVAHKLGADVLESAPCYPSDTGGWQLGGFDLSEYLDRYRDQRLVRIFRPIGAAEPATHTCGRCGFVMNEVGECPRCKLSGEEKKREVEAGGEAFPQEIRGIPDRVEEERAAQRNGPSLVTFAWGREVPQA